MSLLLQRGPRGDQLLPDRRRWHLDTVGFLTIWLVLLVGINARQVVGVFGALGSPAFLLALTTPVLWAGGWILPSAKLHRDPHPMRPALLFWLWAMMCSYVVALARPLTDIESAGALRSLLSAFAWVGVALLVADGVPDLRRLDTLLRRLVLAIGFVSLVGVLQFFTGRALQFGIPGLQWNSDLLAVSARSLFNRPAGTTLHPIEFSVVPAAILPLAIHFALRSPTHEQRRRMGAVAGLIALAVPLSISRSGIVALVVGLAVAATAWTWRQRLSGLITALIVVPMMWLLIPGLIGTLIGLFQGTDTDPSIQARLNRVPRIMGHIRERPWAGLGNGTWSIEDYFLVDNEVWVTTLETGIIGLLLTAALFLLGIVLALSIRRLPGVAEDTGQLAHAVAASIAAIVVSFATFDAFHYRILVGMLFVLLGAAGALWRLHRPARLVADRRGWWPGRDGA